MEVQVGRDVAVCVEPETISPTNVLQTGAAGDAPRIEVSRRKRRSPLIGNRQALQPVVRLGRLLKGFVKPLGCRLSAALKPPSSFQAPVQFLRVGPLVVQFLYSVVLRHGRVAQLHSTVPSTHPPRAPFLLSRLKIAFHVPPK